MNDKFTRCVVGNNKVARKSKIHECILPKSGVYIKFVASRPRITRSFLTTSSRTHAYTDLGPPP